MTVAVVHNHPIHYKHLLFQVLKLRGLHFEVIFAAAQSEVRHETIVLNEELYSSRTAFEGTYEVAPRGVRATETWRCLREINPEIVIIDGYHTAESWSAWIWAKVHRRPTIMWYESNAFDYPKRPWYKELLKRIFVAGLAGAHVYGISNKAYLVQLGLDAERIEVKRAVANVDLFSTPKGYRTYSAHKIKRMLYVGRLAREKNVALVLKAMAAAVNACDEKLWTLTVVGTGPLEQELRQLCIALGIHDVVDFRGYCPQAELPKLYQHADIFVLPSTREPWGLVALEAMLCRTPVAISTQCGCAADLVSAETGWVFSPWSAEQLTQLLLKFPNLSGAQLGALGDACHTLALQYSAPACAERVIKAMSKMDRRGGTFQPELQAGCGRQERS